MVVRLVGVVLSGLVIVPEAAVLAVQAAVVGRLTHSVGAIDLGLDEVS